MRLDVGPLSDNLESDPLAVLHLNNQLYMLTVMLLKQFLFLLMPFSQILFIKPNAILDIELFNFKLKLVFFHRLDIAI